MVLETWTDGQMDEWVNGWLASQVDGLMDGLTGLQIA